MGNFSALLVLLWGESTGHQWISPAKPMTRNFDIFIDLRLNKRFSKQSRRRCRLWNAIANIMTSLWWKEFESKCITYIAIILLSHTSFSRINHSLWRIIISLYSIVRSISFDFSFISVFPLGAVVTLPLRWLGKFLPGASLLHIRIIDLCSVFWCFNISHRPVSKKAFLTVHAILFYSCLAWDIFRYICVKNNYKMKHSISKSYSDRKRLKYALWVLYFE